MGSEYFKGDHKNKNIDRKRQQDPVSIMGFGSKVKMKLPYLCSVNIAQLEDTKWFQSFI